MEDYKKIYEKFWKKIVENKDGSINKDQLMRELADYSNVMDNCTKVYDMVTANTISRPYADFETVYHYFTEYYIHKEMAKEDLIENVLCEEMTFQEIVEAIENYFD